MAIKYRVYSNDLAGGSIDYGTPIYDGPLLTFDSSALAFGSDASFGVRAYDDVTGYEERNISAVYRIVTGSAGENLSLSPPPVLAASAMPGGSGEAIVTWFDSAMRGARAATGFNVYGGTPTVSFGSPLAVVAAASGLPYYRTVLSGLTPGAVYQFSVRPYNANGEQTDSTKSCSAFTIPSAPPTITGGALSVVSSP